MTDTAQVAVADIKINGGTQPRCEINDALVSEYAEAMQAGEQFPPVVVFEDGVGFWLADGFHRTHAARRAGVESIAAEVHQGTKRDAILYSVGANAAHGQRRTNADKRKAVMTLLEDDEWSSWPQRKIAAQCNVTQGFVSKLASGLEETASYNRNKMREVTRGETTFEMNTSNIGRRESSQPDSSGNESDQPDETPKPESRGQGLRFAHEAIATLKRIPYNDGLREDAFDTVINWINANRSRS